MRTTKVVPKLAILALIVTLVGGGAASIGPKHTGSCDTCSIAPAELASNTAGWLLLDTADFPARWNCGTWTAIHGWVHILSDLAIWAAYMTIPIVLVAFIRRRPDVPFAGVFWLFGAFILACGFTHLLEATMFRWPAYRLMGAVKVVTAVISWATVFALVPTLKRALHLENPLAPKLAALVESSADAIVGKTLDGTITSWNPAAERAYGFTSAEVVGQKIDIIIPPDHVEEHAALLRRVGSGERIEGIEAVRVRRDGSRVDVLLSVSPLQDYYGRVTGSVVVHHDVTEQHRANERVHMAIEAAPNGMLMVDESGGIVLANSTAQIVFGYAREEMIGMPIGVIVPELADALRPSMSGSIDSILEASKLGEGKELEALRKDGSSFPVEIGLSPMQTEEGNLIVAGVVDITERKRAEREIAEQTSRLERSNAELNQFAYAAAHDLKAPLQAIRNLSQWIAEDLEGDMSEQTDSYLGLMRGRVLRLEALLDSLLLYARVGDDVGPLEEVDVEVLIASVTEILAPPTGFVISTSGDLPSFWSTRAPLALVFRNLIGNAIKHHDKDSGEIRVTHRELDEHYEFCVSDDGPGIDASHHERIFEMFQTLRPRDEVEGGGMGLALIKKTLESCGSTIALQSSPGRGSTFCFTWPKQEAAILTESSTA